MNPAEIITVRRGLGLSQSAFGKRMGVSWRTVAYWESAQRRPRNHRRRLLLRFNRLRAEYNDARQAAAECSAEEVAP